MTAPKPKTTKDDPVLKKEIIMVEYLGNREIELNLPYLSEQGIKFTAGSTAPMSKADAAKLIRENPRGFKVSMEKYEEEVVEDKKETGFRDADPEDVRAMLASMPSKKAICDYCAVEFGISIDSTLTKETILDTAMQEIQDTADLG